MIKHATIYAVFVLALSSTAFAQGAGAEHFEEAKAAYEAQNYEAAMLSLEQALRAEESPQYLYWRIKTLQAMGEHAHVLELIDQNRDALLTAPEGGELHLMEERSRRELDKAKEPEDIVPPAVLTPEPRTTLNTVGPIVLGVAGLGLALGSIPFWQAECEAPRGDRCLKEGDPQYGLAIGLSAAGALAIGGAITWWVVGTPDQPESTALSVSPLGLRGQF